MPGQSRNEHYLIGFWLRLAAWLIDLPILAALIALAVLVVFGPDGFRHPPPLVAGPMVAGLSGVYLVGFWCWRGATPGQWLQSQRVRDYRDGGAPSVTRCLVRWLSLILSLLPLFLGCLWVAWGREKRAWHDKLSGTVVVSDESYRPHSDDRVFRPGAEREVAR